MTLAQISMGHDIKMAIFNIYQNNLGLMVDITIDKEDFFKVAINKNPKDMDSDMLENIACGYFDSNLAVSVNGQCTNFSIDTIVVEGMVIHFSGSLGKVDAEIKEVNITNTCLIDDFSSHDNIVKLSLNDRKRSFRLNQDRTTTSVYYGD